MDNTTAQRIAKRFVGLPEEQRRQILQKMAETGQSFRLLPIVPTRHDVEQIPLSYAQQRLMFLWQLEPTSSFYNVPMAVRLTGVLDEAAMGRAFGQLFDRHESLRTRFVSLEGVFYQQIEASGNFEFPIHPVQTEAQLEIEVGRVLSEPFDLLDGPLFRARLLSVSPTEHVLAVCMHHIVSDGWSMELMVGEFVRLYEAQCQGVDAQLPELTVQYADYAIWQRAWLEAGEGQRQLAYWQAQLGDEHPLLALPLDRPRPAVATFKGALVPVKLDAQNTAALRAHGRKHGHTMFMTVLAAMAVVLSRFSGQRDIRIGAPNAGRNRQELEGLIGFFINTQVLRVDVDELATPAQLLEQVKDVVAQAQSHQDIPFEQLVDALVPERSLGHNPLFQFKLNQNLSIERAERGVRQNMGGLSIEEYGLARADARFDLAFDFADDERGLEGFFTYATDLFDAALIERMAQAFTQLLGSMANYPHVPLIEQRVDSSACLVGPPLSAPVQDVLGLWRAQVLAQPGRIAVRDAQGELGALTLERESNRLARYLRAQGVGAGDRVALCQNRSGEWVCSLLAVLKSGAAFLPLDPEQPRERLQQLLDDSAAVACIYSSNDPLSTLLNTRVPVLYEPARWAAFEDTPLDLRIVPQSAAYVIYTSGSTGTPKGVVVSHGALAHYTQTALERLALAPDASLAMVSSVAADLGHTVLFGALAGGKTLHLLSREAVFDPDGFAAYMHEQRISVLKIVPSHLQGLLQATQPARVLPAHLLILGGEPCPAVLVEQVRSLKPDCRVVNHYGPTETTVGVLTHELSDEDLAHNIIAVGWPLGGTCVEVLDEYLCNVASGVWGELYIAGPSLADGYLGRPGLTAERFVPDARGDGLRSYRSGDRARVTSQGIAVAGRLDDQVKIRGYRVEPGEVGRCIQRFSGVTQAAVLALPVPGDAQRLQLVAYYVGGSHVSAEALRHYLSETLPDALIPAHFVALDRLPLTSNGKLDRRSLPKPQPQVRQQVAPTDEVQSILAEIWAQVLKLDSVGIADNFFELGGDSILSLQIIAKSKRQGIKITPKQLFEHQTIEALAHVAKRIEAKPAAAVRHSGQDEGTTLLLPAQRRFFEQEIADRHHWNQSILLVPGQPLEQASLAVALERLAQQHAALRLSFPQEAVEQGQAQFERKVPADVLWCCAVESAHEISALADEAQRSLNPARGHVFRAVLINLPDNTQRLLLVAHHLVVDGVSWRILLEDLQALLASGGAWEAGPAAHSLKAWAQALQQHAMQSAMQQELAYWLEQGSVHTGALPMDNPDGAATYRQVSTATSRLDAHLTQALLKVAPAAYRTQINDLLLCALARVLVQWSEQDCVLIELEGHGREDWFEDVDITRTVGWFTSVYPVRLTPEPLMGESIKAIKEQLRSVPNKGLGYGVLRYLGEPAQREQLKGLPAAGITFNYLGQFDGSFDHADTAFVPARESFGRTQSDDAPLSNGLAINGQIYAGQLSLEWTFSHDQYRPETIDALAKAYEQALTELIEHCCASGNLGVTPSDFPLAGLNQAQLDQLPVACDQIEDIYPLSPMQEGLLVHTLLEPGSGIYLMQYCYVIEHEINIALFSQAWGTVVRRHPVLRTSFCWEAGERMVQIVHRDARPDLRVLDWTGIDPDGYECRLALELEEELTIGFDLAHEVPFRLRLVKLGAEHFGFVFSNHHILLDAWCRMGIVAEFFTLYNDLLAGRASTLPTPSRYRDFIAWLEGQDRSQWETFWRNELSGFEQPTRLPFDRTPSREGQDSVIGDRMLCLDEAQT
ncbi:MAG TPA: amino acid adenylation domain-containing protein, partial [Pseudomonas sp.]|uniref:amino acid adenylation domain-containing protein n=1 Tax=Pseudomonas sp. TaxID=306 RepID=UPI002EDB47C5